VPSLTSPSLARHRLSFVIAARRRPSPHAARARRSGSPARSTSATVGSSTAGVLDLLDGVVHRRVEGDAGHVDAHDADALERTPRLVRDDLHGVRGRRAGDVSATMVRSRSSSTSSSALTTSARPCSRCTIPSRATRLR
jgi:hypothetical protein